MKKLLLLATVLLSIMFCLSGCSMADNNTGGRTIIYSAIAFISLVLLIVCLVVARKRRAWLILLFSSVLVVNTGYAFLSMSTNLQTALWANRLSYLGSVFLPLAMLMIVLDVSGTKYPKWLHGALGAVSLIMFLIAASPGVLPIYYKEVFLEIVNGTATLTKVYGPLHSLYLFYLLGYFAAMVFVIIRAQVKKTIDTTAHAVILAIAVFVNFGVWLVEQLVKFDFEMLSISYIISELFLLGIHVVMNEFNRMRTIVKQVEAVRDYSESSDSSADLMLEKPTADTFSPEQIDMFVEGLKSLTPTEKAIFDAYVSRVTTTEISMASSVFLPVRSF